MPEALKNMLLVMAAQGILTPAWQVTPPVARTLRGGAYLVLPVLQTSLCKMSLQCHASSSVLRLAVVAGRRGAQPVGFDLAPCAIRLLWPHACNAGLVWPGRGCSRRGGAACISHSCCNGCQYHIQRATW